LATARLVAQARGYGGLSFRDQAREVGIKAASVLAEETQRRSLDPPSQSRLSGGELLVPNDGEQL
jgi:hypothetical protein